MEPRKLQIRLALERGDQRALDALALVWRGPRLAPHDLILASARNARCYADFRWPWVTERSRGVGLAL